MPDDTNKRVLVTRPMTGPWREILQEAGLEIVQPQDAPDAPLPRADLLRLVKGCDGAISMLTEKWDAEAFDAAGPQLRVVANYAVGFNNIDIEEAARRGIAVTNTPGVLTAATADIAWGLLMMAARRMSESERALRAGGFDGWGPNDWLGLDMEGKTLGIIGPGRIGTAIAKRSRGWDMKVLYAHGERKPAFEEATGGVRVSLEELLRTSDFVSLSVPLTEKTHHLIGERELGMMKKRSVLVNTSRGPVVDEKALVRALREGRVFAAGLDVYEEEPKLAEGLVELENAVLLPHIGSGGFETRAKMAEMAAQNVVAALKGERPPNLVGG